jgi:hypothetical protein
MSLAQSHYRIKPVYYLGYLLAAAVLVSLAWLGASRPVSVAVLPSIEYNTYRCSTRTIDNERVLHVMENQDASSEKLADDLCASKVVADLFGAVEVRWQHHLRADIRNLYEQRFDLGVGRPQKIETPEVKVIANYIPIAGYPDFDSYLIAKQDQPELSAEYFQGKRLGLIHDTNSIAGYQIPRRALANAVIDPSVVQITYYRNHQELRKALMAGEVDVIASNWQGKNDELTLGSVHRLLLDSGLAGAKWYLSPRWVDTPLHCSIVEVLQGVARETQDPGLKNLKLIRDCQL